MNVQRRGGQAVFTAEVRELLHYQLELVEQTRVESDVLRPDLVLLVMRNEIAHAEVAAHLEVEHVLGDRNESIRPFLRRSATKPLRDVGTDAIPVQQTADLLRER